ncbi:hypothetical protein [Leifsonia shinshuensis]|uniref:Uncharacterized protein n=1 Tax=Leifsonia shinshuensis TaxID=150026 RepID=A0A853CVU4_9MICO|nr:hypothetical protein [Leifsonia shinshuensis]NYJ22695.1 hypothetical protein [Leifsonia shinshuensis]
MVIDHWWVCGSALAERLILLSASEEESDEPSPGSPPDAGTDRR